MCQQFLQLDLVEPSSTTGKPSSEVVNLSDTELSDSSDVEDIGTAKLILLQAKSNKRKRLEDSSNKTPKISAQSSPHYAHTS